MRCLVRVYAAADAFRRTRREQPAREGRGTATRAVFVYVVECGDLRRLKRLHRRTNRCRAALARREAFAPGSAGESRPGGFWACQNPCEARPGFGATRRAGCADPLETHWVRTCSPPGPPGRELPGAPRREGRSVHFKRCAAARANEPHHDTTAVSYGRPLVLGSFVFVRRRAEDEAFDRHVALVARRAVHVAAEAVGAAVADAAGFDRERLAQEQRALRAARRRSSTARAGTTRRPRCRSRGHRRACRTRAAPGPDHRRGRSDRCDP